MVPRSRLGLLLLLIVLAFANHSQAQQPPKPRLEVGGILGGTAMSPVIRDCCALRTPPVYTPVAEDVNVVAVGFDARVCETRRLSSIVELAWGSIPDVTLTYPRPDHLPPPFTQYVGERSLQSGSFDFSVSEAFDFLPRERVRLWLAAGFAFSRISATQTDTSISYADPAVRETVSASWSYARVGGRFGGGVRFYPGRHVFVGAQAGVTILGGKDTQDALGTWAVSGDTRGFWRVGAGVVF